MRATRIPRILQNSQCSLEMPLPVSGLWAPGRPRRRRRVPRVSSGSCGWGSSCSHWIHPRPGTATPCHPWDPAAAPPGAGLPQNTQCSKHEFQESQPKHLQFHTHCSHRGSISDGKTLGGLKNQTNPTKNKFLYPQVTSLGAAGTPTDAPPSIPALLLVSVILVLPRTKSNSVLLCVLKYCSDSQQPWAGDSINAAWVDNSQKLPPASCDPALQPLLQPGMVTLCIGFASRSSALGAHTPHSPLPGLGCEHFKAIFVVLLKKKKKIKKSNIWFGISPCEWRSWRDSISHVFTCCEIRVCL